MTNFHRDEAKNYFFLKQKIQNGRLKKLSFSTPPILNIFSWEFQGLMWRASMWLNLYGCQAVQYKLKKGLKMHLCQLIWAPLYLSKLLPPCIIRGKCTDICEIGRRGCFRLAIITERILWMFPQSPLSFFFVHFFNSFFIFHIAKAKLSASVKYRVLQIWTWCHDMFLNCTARVEITGWCQVSTS